MKGSKVLSAGNKYRIENSSGRCCLEVSEAELTDAGTYSCKVSNKLGEAECSCKVIISGKVPNPYPNLSRWI